MASIASLTDIQTPESHLPIIGRLIRLLVKEQHAYRAIEAHAENYREFRTLQCLNRLNAVEAQARAASEQAKALITLWYDSLGEPS